MNIINISGEIGWDVMPEDVKKQLAEAKGKDIEVHVASPTCRCAQIILITSPVILRTYA